MQADQETTELRKEVVIPSSSGKSCRRIAGSTTGSVPVVIPSSSGKSCRQYHIKQIDGERRRNPFFIREVMQAALNLHTPKPAGRNPFFIREVMQAAMKYCTGKYRPGRNPFFIREVMQANFAG